MKIKKWLVPIIFTLVMLLVIWAAISAQSPVPAEGTQSETTLWVSGWHAEATDGTQRMFSVPQRLRTTETVIFNTLPDTISVAQYLYVKTDYQQVTAEVDGNAVPVSGIASASGGAATYDLPWSALEITPDMAGKTIRLIFGDTGSKPWVEVYSIRLGDVSKIQLALTTLALPSIILSLFILLVSLSLMMFAMLEASRHKERIPRGYFYLMGFVLLSAVWFYADSDVSGIAYIGNSTFFFINVYSYLLMPIPYLFFISFIRPSLRRLSVALTVLIALNALLEYVSIHTGYFPLWVGMTCSHVLLAAACVLVLLIILKKPSRALDRLMVMGVAATAVAGVISIALFYLIPIEDNVSAFRYGVIVLMLTLVISLLRANVEIIVQANRMEQLRVREEEYRIAVRQSDKYVLRFDVNSHTLLRGEDSSPLFNADQDLYNMPDSFIAAGNVAEESVADIRIFFNDIIAGKPSGSCAVSLRNRNGEFAWYRIDSTTIYSARNAPLQAVISFFDITEQHQKELAYQKWKQRFADIPSTGMSLYEYNLTRDTLVSQAGKMLPPLPEAVRHSFRSTVDYLADQSVYQDDNQRFRAFLERDRLLELFGHGIRTDKLEFRRVNPDTRVRWTVASIQLIADPYSGDVQSSLLLQDEDEAKRNELTAQGCAFNDPLTGLLNRSVFAMQMSQLLEQTDPGTMHALLMIDLDGFRRVNDAFGHQFGDRVLTDIANSLRAMMRSDDLIGRIGGDEFMVCLRNVREDSGFLEKRSSFICQALNMRFSNEVSLSGSIGVALYPRDGRAFDTLYQKADKALYNAKQHGKNRFTFYRGDLDTNTDPAPSAVQTYDEDPETTFTPRTEVGRTLLIADEEEASVNALCEVFKRDYRLLTTRSGDECLQTLRREGTSVSAVLLNMTIAGINGMEVLRQMQRDAALSSIPVIIASNDAQTELCLQAVEMGATDFVDKPFDPRLVKLRVQNAIHKRETEELRAQNRYLLVQKSDESRHQNELRYIAEHDALTNICNKGAFYRKTKLMLDKAPDTVFVMIAFDIEKFRLINDIFGHGEGDRLLRFIAQRMQTLFGDTGTFSRIDADNFTLCAPYDRQLLRKRMAENDRELKEYDLAFEILLVYGLYIIDDRSLPVSIMHDRAEMAKRTVKGNYVNRFAYYDDNLRKAMLNEIDIINDMNGALQKRQFEIYLQPKCKLNTGEIIGAEALVRWNHPTRGILPPGAFVPIFERNGFIMKMDAYVWEQVCILVRGWMDRYGGEPPIPVSMNVSRVDIYNPALVSTLCKLSEQYGVPRRYIELEITESAYTDDPKLLSELIATLRHQGFTVEMDDFGSAYSSLNMLKEIQVDLLKLDMRFLYGNDPDGRGGTILSSMVRMARYLSLPIVAEGVETMEQARFLSSIGCTLGQGYLFYKPMPVADFERLLTSRPAKPFRSVGDIYPESAVRRVWSIDGDFSLMLSTIPCAASLCELNGDNIELLRINQEYLVMTGDRTERIYTSGTNVRTLTTEQEYLHLLTLLRQAGQEQDTVEGYYLRFTEDGVLRRYRLKIKFLTGDAVRSLFFITYLRADEKRVPGSARAPEKGMSPAPALLGGRAKAPSFTATGNPGAVNAPATVKDAQEDPARPVGEGRGMAPAPALTRRHGKRGNP